MDFYHLNFGERQYFAQINFEASRENLCNSLVISCFCDIG